MRGGGCPGGKRSVTARAWIWREHRGAVFHSKVYVGGRRVHVMSTGTRNRVTALEFSRSHLLSLLSGGASPLPEIAHAQSELPLV